MGRFIDRSGLVGEVGVRRCTRCGLGVSHPPLPDPALLYADRSSQDFQGGAGGIARVIKTIVFRAQARRLLAQAGGAPARIIDYGCGSGLFTRCLQAVLGDRAQVVGADFHREPPADLGPVEYRPFDRLQDLRGSADLLTLMHVLEHDDDPRALLEDVAGLLAPGGVMVIEVPNIDCVWTGVFGRWWDAWYLPYHRLHFSRRSLRALIESCGLEVRAETGVCIPTMGRTLANLLGRRNNLAFILLGAGLHPVQLAVERLTGRPSGLRVTARRPAA
jgi:SAM-dependent methyltransferase